MKKIWTYFSTFEKILWLFSIILEIVVFVLFDRTHYLEFIMALVGACYIIFNAKGNPLGQILCIFFCIAYGITSYFQHYYGELITYACMTLPMAILGLISWLKNPSKESKMEVEINRMNKKQIIIMFVLTTLVTTVFYFILKAFNTANLIVSTISIATSFLAVYMTYMRSKFFALGYLTNDIVLIVLWSLASYKDISYLSVVTCFIIFLLNDTYTFINWIRIEKKQKYYDKKINEEAS